jgi:hypothetical protein
LGDLNSGSSGVYSGGSGLDRGAITAAFEFVLTLKVKILKLDDEVIDRGERVAALTGEGEYARV